MRDTIYAEKHVPASRLPVTPALHFATAPAVRTVETTSSRHPHSDLRTDTSAHSPNDQYVKNAYQKIQLAARSKRGHPISDDSALMTLLVASN